MKRSSRWGERPRILQDVKKQGRRRTKVCGGPAALCSARFGRYLRLLKRRAFLVRLGAPRVVRRQQKTDGPAVRFFRAKGVCQLQPQPQVVVVMLQLQLSVQQQPEPF